MTEEIDICPCGSGKKYAECCRPVITGTQKARTAEALMRARYSAYVAHAIDFIVASCEEGEGIAEIDKKATEDWSRNSIWHGLTILNTEKGGENDNEGTVEFTASYTLKQMRDTMKPPRSKKSTVNGNTSQATSLQRPSNATDAKSDATSHVRAVRGKNTKIAAAEIN